MRRPLAAALLAGLITAGGIALTGTAFADEDNPQTCVTSGVVAVPILDCDSILNHGLDFGTIHNHFAGGGGSGYYGYREPVGYARPVEVVGQPAPEYGAPGGCGC